MRFLPRLTYSNVIATLAIFIALGSVSYAAIKIPKNSVGTKQLKPKAVGTKNIKNKAVKTNRLAGQAVTTGKLSGQAVTEGKVDPNLLASIDEQAKQKVLNADGSVLGTFAGTFAQSPIAIMQVLIDGGLYTYYGSGQLIPLGGQSPSFKTATCDDKAYLEVDQDSFDVLISKLAGGPSRVVFRETDSFNLGPISAWQFTTSSEQVAGQDLWELDSDGTCDPTSSSPYTGVLAELESVPAPPDGTGPLTIG